MKERNDMKTKMNDTELENLFKTVCEGIETLRSESEDGMGRARILFYALSGFLQERGITQDLAAAAGWMGGKKRAASLTPERRTEIAKKAADARWKLTNRPEPTARGDENDLATDRKSVV